MTTLINGQDIETIELIIDYNLCYDQIPSDKIIFNRRKDNTLVAEKLEKSGKTKKLKPKLVITSEQIERFGKWIKTNKKSFLLEELGANKKEIQCAIDTFKSLPTTFPIDFNARIVPDSFSTCSKFSFKDQISSESFKVTFNFYGQKKEFSYTFESTDVGTRDYNLGNYLLIQPLIESSFPFHLMDYNLFTRQHLLTNIINYYKIIECEDFYYTEYLRSNPEAQFKPKQEIRMKIGWDFKAYLMQKM